jgi:putative endonuclease
MAPWRHWCRPTNMALFRLGRTARQRSGDAGEDQALAHLQQQGLVLVERNFSCKGGELDLIMQAGTMLVFVEVRRRHAQQAAPLGGRSTTLPAALP